VNWQRIAAVAAMRGKALITMLRDAKEQYCYVRGKDDPTTQEGSPTVEVCSPHPSVATRPWLEGGDRGDA
jgi:hypothetical protein